MPRTYDKLTRTSDTVKYNLGVGTELKKILRKRFSAEPVNGCPCNGRMREMNARGPAGCRETLDELIGWITEGANHWKADQKGVMRLWSTIVPEMTQAWFVRTMILQAIEAAESGKQVAAT